MNDLFARVLADAQRYAQPKKEPRNMVNMVIVSGTLPRDAESPSPKIVRFTLVNERYFGEGEPRTTFLDCVAFSTNASVSVETVITASSGSTNRGTYDQERGCFDALSTFCADGRSVDRVGLCGW